MDDEDQRWGNERLNFRCSFELAFISSCPVCVRALTVMATKGMIARDSVLSHTISPVVLVGWRF